MTRFGVMKHLAVLEHAGLVITRRHGREKLHYLNPVPIRLVHDRWISKYAEPRVRALSELKQRLEGTPGMNKPVFAHEIVIRASVEKVWQALTDPLSADPPSRVTWELTPMGEGVTSLRAMHDGFETENETYRQVAGGWPFIASGLKTLLETGAPMMAEQG